MSLRLKTILGIALIEAVLLAILLTLTLNYLRSTNFDGLNQRAFSTADLFASTVKNAVLSYDLATVDSFTRELLSSNDITYVVVFGEDGQQISSAGILPERFGPALIEPDSSQVSDGIFDVSSPIAEAGIAFGSVQIGFDMNALNSTIEAAKKWSTLIVIGEMSLVALFSYVLGVYLTKRLSELRRAADAIAAGGRNIQVKTDGNDELAAVSQAFNNMVNQIKASEEKVERYQKQLEEANATLESRVQQRTQALLNTNKQLTVTNLRLKNTQQKLVESEKMASIGTMAAGVAHEINNPMGAVSSNLQMCQSYLNTYQSWIKRSEAMRGQQHNSEAEKQLQDWKQEQYVDCLQEDFHESLSDTMNNVERVRAIVTALQRYASQLNQEKGNRESIKLKPLISHCIKKLAPSKQIKVNLSTSLESLPPLKVHAKDFLQLFTELLKNAIQACERTNKTAGEVSVLAQTDKQRLLIHITDNGNGIANEDITRVYDPFFTTLPVGQGMGLGLTFAYNIVRHHGGGIRIKNRDNAGVVVTLALPLTLIDNATKTTRQSATA